MLFCGDRVEVRICLFILVEIQLETMENSREFNEQPIPSSFHNSCPGNSAVEGGNDEDLVTKSDGGNGKLTSPPDERQKVVGGITCCVPECFRNSLRNPELSFYVIPNGVSKSKQDRRKKWLHMISRKDLYPGPGHRVCSLKQQTERKK